MYSTGFRQGGSLEESQKIGSNGAVKSTNQKTAGTLTPGWLLPRKSTTLQGHLYCKQTFNLMGVVVE